MGGNPDVDTWALLAGTTLTPACSHNWPTRHTRGPRVSWWIWPPNPASSCSFGLTREEVEEKELGSRGTWRAGSSWRGLYLLPAG